METSGKIQKRTIGTLDVRLVLEASIVGLMLIVVMTIISVISKSSPPSLLLMFLTGALVHLGCEFTGIN